MRGRLGLALGILGVLLVVGLAIALALTRRAVRSTALRADSLEAVADTQRMVAGAAVRRMVQAELAKTAVDESLKAKPKVRIVTTIRFDTVRIHDFAGSPVVEVEGVRIDTARVDSAGITGTVVAKLPPPPQPGRWDMTLGIKPFTIIPGVSCSKEKFNGIRRAYVTLDSLPPWAHPDIRSAQASAGVCNPIVGFGVSLKTTWWTVLLGAAAGFLAGRAF